MGKKRTLTVVLILLMVASVAGRAWRPEWSLLLFENKSSPSCRDAVGAHGAIYHTHCGRRLQPLRHQTTSQAAFRSHPPILQAPRKTFLPFSAFFKDDKFRCLVINSIPLIADNAVRLFPFQIRFFFIFLFSFVIKREVLLTSDVCLIKSKMNYVYQGKEWDGKQ